MLERMLELKEIFESENPKWKFGLVDYVDNLIVTDKTVYLVIESEEEDYDKSKKLNISFYYCRSRIKDQFIEFRNEVSEFKELARDILDDFDFRATNWNIDYGINGDKDSIRIAKISVIFDVVERKKEPDFELMQKLYLEI
ncbi:MAG: hypothetical protein ACRCU6_12430 [Fusobacteriaceae bacterium]